MALLAAMLAASPVLADDASKSTDKPDDVQKQLKDLKSSVAELKASQDGVKEVLESLKNLQGEVKQASGPRGAGRSYSSVRRRRFYPYQRRNPGG